MSVYSKIIESGIKAASIKIGEEDRIWSKFSHDKVDIGEVLAKVIRTLNKEFPLKKQLRALSIGSSSEPQFRILETAFRGGLYLFDIDKKALSVVRERIQRQCTDHAYIIHGDYNKIFLNQNSLNMFVKEKLDGEKVELVTLHHSLYYCQESVWLNIFENLYRKILADKGGIHAVLMTSESHKKYTTTWLYNYFAGKYFGCRNDQDLCKLRHILEKNILFNGSQIYTTTHYIKFIVNDFIKLMAVVWMILLYPEVHKYTLKQREEITEFIYKHFWLEERPLIQAQDHLVLYRGVSVKGLI